MRFDGIVGYVYAADTYCPECIVEVLIGGPPIVQTAPTEDVLDALAKDAGIDRYDEHTYDSDTFPKVIFAINVHSGDEPDYCGRCHELLAPYECSICGDAHGESAHGEPLVMRDTGRDTVTGLVETFTDDAAAILVPNVTYALTTIRTDLERRLGVLRAEWEAHTDDERDEYAPEYLDDIDSILTDAGYHPITDADMGTWCVYAPVPGSAAEPDATDPSARVSAHRLASTTDQA